MENIGYGQKTRLICYWLHWPLEDIYRYIWGMYLKNLIYSISYLDRLSSQWMCCRPQGGFRDLSPWGAKNGRYVWTTLVYGSWCHMENIWYGQKIPFGLLLIALALKTFIGIWRRDLEYKPNCTISNPILPLGLYGCLRVCTHLQLLLTIGIFIFNKYR
jgi:hypothetical protein